MNQNVNALALVVESFGFHFTKENAYWEDGSFAITIRPNRGPAFFFNGLVFVHARDTGKGVRLTVKAETYAVGQLEAESYAEYVEAAQRTAGLLKALNAFDFKSLPVRGEQ